MTIFEHSKNAAELSKNAAEHSKIATEYSKIATASVKIVAEHSKNLTAVRQMIFESSATIFFISVIKPRTL